MPNQTITQRRAKGRQRYHEARDAGLCVQCRRVPPVAQRVMCEHCAEGRRENMREYRAKQRRIADLFAERA